MKKIALTATKIGLAALVVVGLSTSPLASNIGSAIGVDSLFAIKLDFVTPMTISQNNGAIDESGLNTNIDYAAPTEEQKVLLTERRDAFNTDGEATHNRAKLERQLRDLSDREMKNVDAVLKPFNLSPIYGFDNKLNKCFDSSFDSSNVVALVCDAAPTKVFIRDEATKNDFGFNSALRHEIAHTQILKTCGTFSPPGIINGKGEDRTEAVTSSYAVLFLGADKLDLNSIPNSEYRMDRESDQMAKDIHSGKMCAF